MKMKSLKTIMFSLTLAAMAAIPACSAFAAETTECGAYETFGGDEIPEEALEKFDLAVSTADYDAQLKPITLLETQIVAGTNYRFLAAQIPNAPEDPVSAVIVTVYADLNGNAEITAIDESDEKVVIPENSRPFDFSENKDFDMQASFSKDDFDLDQKALHVKLYQEALYDTLDVHELAVGDYLELPDGTFTEVTSLEESADDNNNQVISVNNGTLNLTAYEGGTYNCPLDNDLTEMIEVAETDLPIGDDLVFTDCGQESGSSVLIAAADLPDYLESLDDTEEAMSSTYSYWNTHISVTDGVITDITRIWMP